MKKLIPFSGIFLCLTGLSLYLLYSIGGKISLLVALGEHGLLMGLAVALSSLAIGGIYYGLLSRLPWRRHVTLRFVTSWLLLWALGVGYSYLLGHLMKEVITQTGLYGDANATLFVLTGAIVSLLLSLLFTLGDFSWYTYYRYAAETLARMRAQRRQKELQFDVLRAQLTPHYLFNSLNTASNLISYDSSGAELYLRKLAHNIRYLMQQQDEVLSTLQNELEIVDSFFHLMQVRYGDRIRLLKDIDTNCMQHKVPTLALQLLVENAIKHNVASQEQPVNIQLRADKKGIVVENNITRPPLDAKSGKLGLHNLQERYLQLSGKSVEIRQADGSFRIALPYISRPRKEAYV